MKEFLDEISIAAALFTQRILSESSGGEGNSAEGSNTIPHSRPRLVEEGELQSNGTTLQEPALLTLGIIRGTRGIRGYEGYPGVRGVSGGTRGIRGYEGYPGVLGVSGGTRGITGQGTMDTRMVRGGYGGGWVGGWVVGGWGWG